MLPVVKRRKCARCGRNRGTQFYVSDRGRVCSTCRKRKRSHTTHAQHIGDTYGITVEEELAILELQGGVCAICKGARNYTLQVDHDHELVRRGFDVRESVRGKLCKNCNRRLLTAAHDSVEILLSAVAYLQNPPAQVVLRNLT